MPIYDYFCQACGKQSEIMQRISDPQAVDCPLCGKSALTKQLSAAGFRLKGGGWYETDFKSGSKKNLAGEGGAAAAASGGDAKPAAADAKPATGKDSAKAAPVTAPAATTTPTTT